MTNGTFGKLQKGVKKSAKTLAQQAAKTVKEEREGFFESTKKQVAGEKENKSDKDQPSVYKELVKNGHVSPEEEAQIKSKTSGKIQKLEAELQQLRVDRQKKEEQWRQDQEALMKKPDQEEGQGSIPLPTSPQKGPKGPAGKKKAKGSGEMIKSKK